LNLILISLWLLIFYSFPSFADELLWERSGGNNRSHQYSPLSQINEENIKNLEVAWVYKSGFIDRAQTVQTNPIIANNFLITSSLDGFVIAINSINGKEAWRKKLPSPVARRGLTFYDNSVYVPTSSGIYILNVADGIEKKKVGDSLSYLPPIVTNDKIFVANLNSTVQAWNNNGDLIWTLSLVKDNVYPRIWSGISFDPDSKLIFINTSNANGLIGGDIKNGGYSCSVIAINSSNGKVVWSFQEVIHDVWDLDIVGPPVITKIMNNGRPRAVVASVSKSGNVILLDKYNGKPIFGIEKYSVPPSLINSEKLSSYQIKISKPENFSDIYFDLERDITNLSQPQKDYVEHKLRNAKSDRFLSVNPNFDVVMFGLHGGAEWPGMSLDEDSGIIIVPSNKYPWILRASYFDKDESKSKLFAGKNLTYTSKCALCHGPSLAGALQNEYEGDLYFPSLIGITQKRSYEYLTSIEKFRFNHKYAASDVNRYHEQETLNRFFLRVDSNLLNKLLAKMEKVTGGAILKSYPDYKYLKQTIDNVSEADLKNLFMLFTKIDNNIIENNRLGMTANWQLLLDNERNPGSKPPWGYLTAINLNTGKKVWQQPFGDAYNKYDKKYYKGDINLGGTMITKSKIVFANGTRDAMARAFKLNTGELLWESKLPAAGSAPPMSYIANGCQFIIFTATGNWLINSTKKSDSLVAYKHKDCRV
jgi:quinoprotein glucose dehydrogenase